MFEHFFQRQLKVLASWVSAAIANFLSDMSVKQHAVLI